MSVGEIAGLIAAIAFAVLVLAIAVPLVRLGSLIGSVQTEVVIKQVVPLLGQTQSTVEHVNTNLANAESVTTNAVDISSNVRALITAFSATLGGPLVKIASFTYGVRRAASRHEKEQIAQEVKAQRKAAKRASKTRKSAP